MFLSTLEPSRSDWWYHNFTARAINPRSWIDDTEGLNAHIFRYALFIQDSIPRLVTEQTSVSCWLGRAVRV